MFQLPLGGAETSSGLSLAQPLSIDVELSTSSINGGKGEHINGPSTFTLAWFFLSIRATVPL